LKVLLRMQLFFFENHCDVHDLPVLANEYP
jgi:hypothetical protein